MNLLFGGWVPTNSSTRSTRVFESGVDNAEHGSADKNIWLKWMYIYGFIDVLLVYPLNGLTPNGMHG